MTVPLAGGVTADHVSATVPAPVVAQYLRENRVVAEKFDLNSLLFLLTPGVEASNGSANGADGDSELESAPSRSRRRGRRGGRGRSRSTQSGKDE